MSGRRLPEPRPDLAGLAAYRTDEGDARVRLHANESSDPAEVTLTLGGGARTVALNRYPSKGGELADVLARQLGAAPEQLVLGNGSNEMLLAALLAYGGAGRRILLFQPTYAMYARLATIAGGTVAHEMVGIPYRLTAATVRAAVERTDPHVVVLCSPNNPTGSALGPEAVDAAAAARPSALVVVDEAYAEFGTASAIPAIARHRNVAVARTFSKARAAAGLRLGVLVADAEVAAVLRAVSLPYSPGALTLAAGAVIAADEEGLAARVAACRAERDRVAAALAASGADVQPSAANFLLLRVADPAATHAALLEQGVLVRDVSAWPGCAGGLRVSIGTREENDAFLAALARVPAGAAAG